MISLEKLLKNVGDLGRLIVAKGYEKLPKVQWIAQSGHTAPDQIRLIIGRIFLFDAFDDFSQTDIFASARWRDIWDVIGKERK